MSYITSSRSTINIEQFEYFFWKTFELVANILFERTFSTYLKNVRPIERQTTTNSGN